MSMIKFWLDISSVLSTKKKPGTSYRAFSLLSTQEDNEDPSASGDE